MKYYTLLIISVIFTSSLTLANTDAVETAYAFFFSLEKDGDYEIQPLIYSKSNALVIRQVLDKKIDMINFQECKVVKNKNYSRSQLSKNTGEFSCRLLSTNWVKNNIQKLDEFNSTVNIFLEEYANEENANGYYFGTFFTAGGLAMAVGSYMFFTEKGAGRMARFTGGTLAAIPAALGLVMGIGSWYGNFPTVELQIEKMKADMPKDFRNAMSLAGGKERFSKYVMKGLTESLKETLSLKGEPLFM